MAVLDVTRLTITTIRQGQGHMGQLDYITKHYNTTSTRNRACASIFVDGDGKVYSYGYHYPLLFNIAGIDILNVAGYSATTRQHIAKARTACRDAIRVKLTNVDGDAGIFTMYDISKTSLTDIDKLKYIYYCVIKELTDVTTLAGKKKRKNTKVYTDLIAQRDYLTDVAGLIATYIKNN